MLMTHNVPGAMDMGTWTEYAKLLAALLAIVNPIGTVPIFVNLTSNQTRVQRHHTGFVAAMAVGLILVSVLLTGEAILRFFGISFASFRVAGGILILLMSISMMHGRLSPAKQTEEEAADTAEKESIAVVPIGMPLLAGPGAISTVILYAQRHTSPVHYLLIGLDIVLVALSVWGAFRAAPYLASVLGRTGINIVTRIMGLIMASIGVEFIANGMKQLFPALS